MARPNPTPPTPGKLPEFLVSESLGAWFAAELTDMVERERREADEAGLSRANRVRLDNLERAVIQVEGFHVKPAPVASQ